MTISDFISDKDKIEELRKEIKKLRVTIGSQKTTLKRYNCKSVNMVRNTIKLREEGFLSMTNQEIADRHFVSKNHVRTLTTLIRQGN